ncbi:unnamed protein product, partial [Polarella glacialis]
VISCAAAASTEISADGAAVKTLEVYGAMLALIKAFLSSSGAVMSEAFYKKGKDSFWVVSFRVQIIMLMTSLVLLPVTTGKLGLEVLHPSEFFFGGPNTQCVFWPDESKTGCQPEFFGETCTCATQRGWDWYTVLAVLSIALNGFTTGLTLKYLSAVSKSICGALSSGVFYIAYVCAGFRPFSFAQANVLAIVVLGSLEFAMEKAEPRASQDSVLSQKENNQSCSSSTCSSDSSSNNNDKNHTDP